MTEGIQLILKNRGYIGRLANIHPLILYDESKPGEVERVLAAGDEILRACLDLGGSISGEHGIGVEKLGLMGDAFGPETLAAMADLRAVFNPRGLCNPGKVFPTERACVEARGRMLTLDVELPPELTPGG